MPGSADLDNQDATQSNFVVDALFRRLQDRYFQTRAMVQPCTGANTSITDFFVLISTSELHANWTAQTYSENRDLNSAGLRKSDGLKYQVEVTLGDARDPTMLWER
ncbi:hypothetical protein BDV93DRAFT_513986 [Ceratobasidium sp. AG-I]|nr:hypothetical protein BDV93DRAFT_513986 [Ceratobasidium sp. AG-I]